MSEECSHNCSDCNKDCSTKIVKEKLNDYSTVKKVYAVVSGKGGVGKSTVTSLMAVSSMRSGKKTAILDADITGPSIPKAFGISEKVTASEEGMFPLISKKGIEIISMNGLLDKETSPVVWRGPVIAGAIKQFWSDVIWNDVDVMFVDCPPGTGDVPLTVFQSLPIDGVIIVTTPQQLVEMIVEKAINMAELMNVPVVGLVENMAYFTCEKCGEKHYVFGKGNAKAVAEKHNIPNYVELPFNEEIAALSDKGLIELNENYLLDSFLDEIIK